MRATARSPKVAAFTGPHNTPARLARALLAAGYDERDQLRLSVASRLLLPDEKLYPDLSPEQAAAIDFAEPNVVIVERAADARLPTFGFADDEFVQRFPEKGLITKQEARALSLAKLRVASDAVVWDIGAGSGSVGIEASRLAPQGHVYAIEKNDGDAANALANARRFRATNYTLAVGRAPEGLDRWPDPDAVFVGGSGGELAALIDLILARLKPGGRLVMNFVTIENLASATAALQAAGASDGKSGGISWDVVQLQASRSQPILDMHRMAAQNPVWIVTAAKDMDHGGHGEHGEHGEKPE
jgi:precorrin-6Y C5,15-methyltransferase (decarboxylating)